MTKKTIRILLIEDNPGDARLIEEMFSETESGTCDLVWTENLAAGLERLSKDKYDVVLADLSLPDSDGFRTFSTVYAGANQIPIILMTGLDDAKLATQMVQQGAQDYLVKGHVDAHQLLRAVRYAIERNKAEKQLTFYADEFLSKNEELRAEMEMARELQQAFLPDRYPTFPRDVPEEDSALRFHPLRLPCPTFSGNFFSILPVSETAAGILICDVMGSRICAAIIMSFLRGLVEKLKSVSSDPSALLKEMNREMVALLRRTSTSNYVSAFYLIADVSKGEIRYASAGHPAPLHIRRSAGIAEPLPSESDIPSLLLGLLEDFPYPTSRRQTAAGDSILLFTEGLLAVETAEGRRFDQGLLILAGVRKSVSQASDRIMDDLVAEARRFASGAALPGDICLLSVDIVRGGLGKGL